MPVKNSSTTTNRFSVEMNFLTMTKNGKPWNKNHRKGLDKVEKYSLYFI